MDREAAGKKAEMMDIQPGDEQARDPFLIANEMTKAILCGNVAPKAGFSILYGNTANNGIDYNCRLPKALEREELQGNCVFCRKAAGRDRAGRSESADVL